jgi:hypothetical protein
MVGLVSKVSWQQDGWVVAATWFILSSLLLLRLFCMDRDRDMWLERLILGGKNTIDRSVYICIIWER